MAYVNYYKQLKTLENVPWYKIDDLVIELISIRRINFALTEQRQQALERLNNISIFKPFSETSRFEQHSTYVCEALGDWSRKFQQLKSSLSYKDKELRSTVKDQMVHEPPTQGYNDSQQSFWNATTAMYDQLVRDDGVYDRVEFERKFNLQWGGLVQQN